MQYKHFKYQIISFDLINISIIFQVYINYVLHYYYYSSSNKDASDSRLDIYSTKSEFN